MSSAGLDGTHGVAIGVTPAIFCVVARSAELLNLRRLPKTSPKLARRLLQMRRAAKWALNAETFRSSRRRTEEGGSLLSMKTPAGGAALPPAITSRHPGLKGLACFRGRK